MASQRFSFNRKTARVPKWLLVITFLIGYKDRRLAREAGYHKHIAKPVTPAVLIAAVTTLLSDKDRANNGE